MADAGILSAPVLDAIDGHPASNWLGFLDVSDIVTALLKGARDAPLFFLESAADSYYHSLCPRAQSCTRGCLTSRIGPRRAA